MKKITALATICSGLLSTALAAEVWAPGVSLEGGWYDFNKYSKGGTPNSNAACMNDDGLMCWAAAGANVIAWWQTQNKITSGGSFTIPQGEDIYQTFVAVFENGGYDPTYAFRWWVNGDLTYMPKRTEFDQDAGGPPWEGEDGKTYYPDSLSSRSTV